MPPVETLAGLALSLFGFTVYLAVDLPPLHRSQSGRAVALVLGALALAMAFSRLRVAGGSLGLPSWMAWPGFVLLAAGLVLLVYSVFLEIPLALWRRRAPQEQAAVVDTGSYALCRHPGFWWLLLFLIGAFAAYGRTGTLLLAVTWTSLNFILVTLQDRYVFPTQFPDYASYQQTTPFLVPTRSSFRQALSTLGGHHATSEDQ